MRTSRLALVMATASFGLAAVRADPDLSGLQAEEEDCLRAATAAGEEEDRQEGCALSLRQLRARGADGVGAAASATIPAAVSAALSPSPASAAVVGSSGVDSAVGVPGGWGEAAEFAATVSADEKQNMTLKAQWSDFDDDGYGNGWSSGSCAGYGCINYYAPWHQCQCNHHCSKYGSCCNDYTQYCHGALPPSPSTQAPTPAPYHHPGRRNVMTLYHQTDQRAANLIKANGFRPGSSGWCGGAIYFATSAAATYTKAIGPQSHKGAMLSCQVDVGRVLPEGKTCGGHPHNQAELNRLGFDSVSFNPGDGIEYVIWDKSKVLSITQIPL